MNTNYPNLSNEPLNYEGQRCAVAEVTSVIGDNLNDGCLTVICPIARTWTEARIELEECIACGVPSDLVIVEINPSDDYRKRTIIRILE